MKFATFFIFTVNFESTTALRKYRLKLAISIGVRMFLLFPIPCPNPPTYQERSQLYVIQALLFYNLFDYVKKATS
jgi:hypothetical protein